MERLTEKHYNGDGYYMKCSETCPSDCSEICDCEELDRIVDRLGAIEAILGDDYDLDRLRELVESMQAEVKSPHPDDDSSILACPCCGSGEYLENEDGNENRFCGQCGQRVRK